MVLSTESLLMSLSDDSDGKDCSCHMRACLLKQIPCSIGVQAPAKKK